MLPLLLVLLLLLLVVVQEEDALVAQVQEQMRGMAAQHAAAVEELQSKLKWWVGGEEGWGDRAGSR